MILSRNYREILSKCSETNNKHYAVPRERDLSLNLAMGPFEFNILHLVKYCHLSMFRKHMPFH